MLPTAANLAKRAASGPRASCAGEALRL